MLVARTVKQDEIAAVLRQARSLREQEKNETDHEARRRLFARRQLLLRTIHNADDEFAGKSVEAVLEEINAIYKETPEDRLEYNASAIRLRLLWGVVERKKNRKRRPVTGD